MDLFQTTVIINCICFMGAIYAVLVYEARAGKDIHPRLKLFIQIWSFNTFPLSAIAVINHIITI